MSDLIVDCHFASFDLFFVWIFALFGC